MFSIFQRKIKATTPEQEFWNWFLLNKKKIEKFIDSDHTDYSVYESLTEKMRAYHIDLVPELTKTEENNYVLIITPDGIKAGIKPTKELAAAKPDIENWLVQKFRQPCDEITLEFDSLTYPTSNIKVLPQIDNEEGVANLDVFIVEMNNDQRRYKSLAFLYLDHIIGEFNTLTKVGYIAFHNLDKNASVENSLSLLQLRELIAKELY